MHKPILISLAILLSFSDIFAQDKPITFGAKFGYSHSNVEMPSSIEFFDGFGATDNFHVGVVGELALPRNFGLKGELLYSQKGGESFFDFSIATQNTAQIKEKLRYDFITFPVLLTYRFSAFQLEGGIETAFRQNSKFIFEDSKVNVNATDDRFDFGLNAGINYLFKSVVIGIRYNHGLKAQPFGLLFTDDNGNILETQPSFLNRVWQFSVMYRI